MEEAFGDEVEVHSTAIASEEEEAAATVNAIDTTNAEAAGMGFANTDSHSLDLPAVLRFDPGQTFITRPLLADPTVDS